MGFDFIILPAALLFWGIFILSLISVFKDGGNKKIHLVIFCTSIVISLLINPPSSELNLKQFLASILVYSGLLLIIVWPLVALLFALVSNAKK